ncbi:MAG: TonB-dependent receptor plug domain-containing protein [Bacteroidales bacterium]|nr:TonB-dependent receptor plug domain-containing protein [Bacteroidales bacterium]
MKLYNKILISVIVGLVMVPAGMRAQERIVEGKVVAFGNIPLNNVEVRVLRSEKKTFTDSLGIFSISCSDRDKLRINASGFNDVKLKVRKIDRPLVELAYSNQKSSFSAAVNSGHISEDTLQAAIDNYLKENQKDYSVYTNIYQLIDTEIFDVNVNGQRITTRKISSITQGQQVLLVVDGMVVDDISFVSPLNVASVRFVDGAQAAKYGSLASNGAIEITTKK